MLVKKLFTICVILLGCAPPFSKSQLRACLRGSAFPSILPFYLSVFLTILSIYLSNSFFKVCYILIYEKLQSFMRILNFFFSFLPSIYLFMFLSRSTYPSIYLSIYPSIYLPTYLSIQSTHERVHTGSKPYQCKFCAKTFRTATQRSVHHFSHTKVSRDLPIDLSI